MTAILDGPDLVDIRSPIPVTNSKSRLMTDQYVGEWPSLAIYMKMDPAGGGGAQRILATWGDKQTPQPSTALPPAGQAMRDFLWSPNAAAPLNGFTPGWGDLGEGGVLVPNYGQFATLELQRAGGGGTATPVIMRAWGTTREPRDMHSFSQANPGDPLVAGAVYDVLFDVAPLTVGAGATVSQLFNFWYAGPVQVWSLIFGAAGAVGSSLTIKTLRNDRSLAYLDQVNTSSVEERRRVWIPPRPCWVEAHNATAGNLDFYMTVSPEW